MRHDITSDDLREAAKAYREADSDCYLHDNNPMYRLRADTIWRRLVYMTGNACDSALLACFADTDELAELVQSAQRSYLATQANAFHNW